MALSLFSILFSIAWFKYSKSEPSIICFMVFESESSQFGKPIMGLCWKFSSEEWGIQREIRRRKKQIISPNMEKVSLEGKKWAKFILFYSIPYLFKVAFIPKFDALFYILIVQKFWGYEDYPKKDRKTFELIPRRGLAKRTWKVCEGGWEIISFLLSVITRQPIFAAMPVLALFFDYIGENLSLLPQFYLMFHDLITETVSVSGFLELI